MLLAMMMSGTDQSGEIEAHLNNSNIVTDIVQEYTSDNNRRNQLLQQKWLYAHFLHSEYYLKEIFKKEAKERRLEPLYRNTLWKSRLKRIKRDGKHGHYDCGPNYFSVFPFFIFIQSFATTGAVPAKYLGF